MTGILDRIGRYKLEEVRASKTRRPLAGVEAAARLAPAVRPFAGALAARIGTGAPALIGEIKKASPSKGLIRADFDPAALARAYESGGATCLSVLTDGPSFAGAAEHLTAARGATSLPVLRKDFMLDPYQMAEARSWGADCILIILAQVDDGTAGELAAAAESWGMDAIAEVHDEAEMERAALLGCRLIGINNRNLKTFETTLATTERLAPLVPPDRIAISESGIFTGADIERIAACGIHAFLVGESLMRQADVARATRALLGEAP
jgi:indole-3-glycerol phosphate synthase